LCVFVGGKLYAHAVEFFDAHAVFAGDRAAHGRAGWHCARARLQTATHCQKRAVMVPDAPLASAMRCVKSHRAGRAKRDIFSRANAAFKTALVQKTGQVVALRGLFLFVRTLIATELMRCLAPWVHTRSETHVCASPNRWRD
jgi:hypothetical protein